MNNYIFIKCGVFVDDNREDIRGEYKIYKLVRRGMYYYDSPGGESKT